MSRHTPIPSPSPTTRNPPSVSVDLPVLDVSHQWKSRVKVTSIWRLYFPHIMLDCVVLGRKLMEVSCLCSFINQVENGRSAHWWRDQSGIRALTIFTPQNQSPQGHWQTPLSLWETSGPEKPHHPVNKACVFNHTQERGSFLKWGEVEFPWENGWRPLMVEAWARSAGRGLEFGEIEFRNKGQQSEALRLSLFLSPLCGTRERIR